jgi:Spy/CpxP family protein refolding chaperone
MLTVVPSLLSAGEFSPRRYIEPNPVSNLFTRMIGNGFINRLQLTAEQQQLIRLTIDPHREQFLAELTAVMEARGNLLDTLQADPYDPEAVRLAYQAVAVVQADLVVHAGAVAREVQKVLSPEQLAEVNEMIEETREAIDVRLLDFSQDFAARELPGAKGSR